MNIVNKPITQEWMDQFRIIYFSVCFLRSTEGLVLTQKNCLPRTVYG